MTYQHKMFAVFGLISMAGMPHVRADETALKTVVVTATRTEMEEFQAPANISVITRDALANGQYSNMTEALKDVPGVTIQNYGASGSNYTSNSLYINGSDRIVVLIDGMRVNTNGSTMSRFSASELVDMSRIERIEVLKGSASTLYGSDAAGGVINIITRRPEEAQLSTTVGYTAGSYGLSKYNVRHAGSKNGYYWTFNGQKRYSDDYKDGAGHTTPEDIKEDNYALQLGKKFDDGVSFVQLDFNKYDVDYMRPNNVGKGDMSPKYGNKDNSRFGLTYLQKINDNLNNKFSFFQNINNLKDGLNYPSSIWLMDLETIGFNDQITYRTGDHLLTGGIDYYDDKIHNYQSGSAPKMTRYTGKSISSKAIFIQDEWSFASGWTLTPGFRIDRHELYGSHNSPAVTLSYQPSDQTNLYASYKESFVAPNQFQIYSPTYGNPNLKAETGKTVELGIKHRYSKSITATANVYQRKSKDAIAYNSTTEHYANLQSEDATGASATLNFILMPHLIANVGYTYTHIDAQEGENLNRNGYLPRDAWNLGLNYAKGTLNIDANARGIYGREGRKQDTYANKQTEYWIVDLATNYKPYKNIKLFAKLNNIFDKYYTDRVYDLNPDNWYAQPGRNFQAGVEYTF